MSVKKKKKREIDREKENTVQVKFLIIPNQINLELPNINYNK